MTARSTHQCTTQPTGWCLRGTGMNVFGSSITNSTAEAMGNAFLPICKFIRNCGQRPNSKTIGQTIQITKSDYEV